MNSSIQVESREIHPKIDPYLHYAFDLIKRGKLPGTGAVEIDGQIHMHMYLELEDSTWCPDATHTEYRETFRVGHYCGCSGSEKTLELLAADSGVKYIQAGTKGYIEDFIN